MIELKSEDKVMDLQEDNYKILNREYHTRIPLIYSCFIIFINNI